MISNFSPIVCCISGQKRSNFEMRFQSKVSYWTLGGPAATGSFAGGINPKDISLLS
jgi:hypothetical protein